MAKLTGLFQRGSSYYVQVVLPLQHPLRHRYKNGKYVVSLGRCSHREALLKGTLKRAQILLGIDPLQVALSAPSPPPASGHRLANAYDRWKCARKRSLDSEGACLRAVKLYEEFTDDAPIEGLTRELGDGFRAWLLQPERGTTSKTARDRMNWVKSVLKYAQQDLGWLSRNPWEGIEIAFKTRHKRRPWSSDELGHLLAQPLFTRYELPTNRKAGGSAAYWIPLLGLFSGARVSELAQLLVSDFKKYGGIHVMSISDESPDQQVKTAAAVRQVPLHPELIRLGLLDYIADTQAAGHKSLWPTLKPRKNKAGGFFSAWFGEYRASLGFGTYPDFHCLRHTVRSQLAEAGISEQTIDTLIGHEVKGSTGATVYTHRSAKSLFHAISRLRYDTSDLKRRYARDIPST